MSKEYRAAGLGRVFFDYRAEPTKAKREVPLVQGRFVPEASDRARLLPGLVPDDLSRHCMPRVTGIK